MACLIATALALLLGLTNPYWATMTAWSTTALPGRHLGCARAFRQILGTGLGCLLGYQFSLHAQGYPAVQWLGLFLIAGGGTFMRFRSQSYYAWNLGSFSSIMLVAITLYSPEVLYPDAFYRGYEIICGVAGVLFAQLPVGLILKRFFPRPPGPPEPPPRTMLDVRDAAHIGRVGALTGSIVPGIWSVFHLPVGSLLITMITLLAAL